MLANHCESPNSNSSNGRMLDVIDINFDGSSLLAASTLCNRYWTGYLSIFSSPHELLSQSNNCSLVDFEGGLSCAKFIPNTKHVIAGSDNGVVSLINTQSSASVLANVVEHDSVVSCLSLTANGQRAVTGSLDHSLKVWHTDHLICSHTYRPAHADMVISVSINKEEDDVMISCAEDGSIVLWDLRMPKPAHEIQNDLFDSRPSCVSFLSGDSLHSNSLMVGTVTGHLLRVDISARKALFEVSAHKRSIKKIRSTNIKGNVLVATCGEDNKTVVASVSNSESKILYADERHNDVVTGLCWSTKDDTHQLYSCGWDGQIIAHEIAC